MCKFFFLKKMSFVYKKSYQLLQELQQKCAMSYLLDRLYVHKGTFNRWMRKQEVPENYYNDLNALLGNKYPVKSGARVQDQFFTTEKTANYCYNKMLAVLKELYINEKEYNFIEPSAGCCNFYKILPEDRRIGIDIEPKGELKEELIKINYLDFVPQDKTKKYIVVGNPPFGLRGNLALRFINHSLKFADVVAFILPPLFNSTGKGVPMKRVEGYKLAYSEKLPANSYQYPDGKPVDVATIFQVWTKINCDKIKIENQKTCKQYLKVYSLSDGGTPSSTRNKKMLDKCDIYLPSTCFKGMKVYNSFEELPNRRGYGVVFFKDKEKLQQLYKNTNWGKVAFISTNGAINLRTDLIESVALNGGFYDK